MNVKEKIQKTDRKKAAVLFAILLLFLISVVWLLISRSRETTAQYASVTLDGNVLKKIDLSTVTEPYTFTVTGESGVTNTIEVRKGAIGVTKATCPDQICVKRGFCNTNAAPIVCMPNHLEITLSTDPFADEDSLDAILS